MGHSYRHSVKISYQSPGAQPPVFVAGAFTNPPWHPYELECEALGEAVAPQDGKEHRFSKEFVVEEGEWQYKFRLGTGDWWVCDENAEIVTDDSGNRNNLLVVVPHNIEHRQIPHEDKSVHCRPVREESSADDSSAWEVIEDGSLVQRHAHQATGDNVAKASASGKWLDPECARKGLERCSDESEESTDSLTLLPTISDESRKGRSKHRAVPRSPEKAQIPVRKLGNIHSTDAHFQAPDWKDNDEPKISDIDVENFKRSMFRSPSAMFDPSFDDEIDHVPIQHSPTMSRRNEESNAPLMPHECLTCEDHKPQFTLGVPPAIRLPHETEKNAYIHEDDEQAIDESDSSLEVFPSGAENILQRIATLQEEIPPDDSYDSDDNGIDTPNDSPNFLSIRTPTLSHELPPIGSQESMRLQRESMPSTPYVIHDDLDGAPDDQFRDEQPSQIKLEGGPREQDAAHADEHSRSLNDPVDSFEHQPLLSSSEPKQEYSTVSSIHINNEGARLRAARIDDNNGSESDSSEEEELTTRSFWQRILDWFHTLWVSLWESKKDVE